MLDLNFDLPTIHQGNPYTDGRHRTVYDLGPNQNSTSVAVSTAIVSAAQPVTILEKSPEITEIPFQAIGNPNRGQLGGTFSETVPPGNSEPAKILWKLQYYQPQILPQTQTKPLFSCLHFPIHLLLEKTIAVESVERSFRMPKLSDIESELYLLCRPYNSM